MKKSTLYVLIISGVLLLCLAIFGWIVVGPSGPIILSKQTTYITRPLRPNGLVDYERALVEMQRDGVTPEENAAIPLLQAMWPCGLTPEEQFLICDALEMPEPEQPGMVTSSNRAVLEAIIVWLNEQQQAKLGADNFTLITASEAIEVINEAYDTPWTSLQLPPLAAWLDQQAAHFEQLHAMNERPKFFLPPPAMLDNRYDSLLTHPLPALETQREAVRSLCMRAMLHCGEKRPAEAWLDIKTALTVSRCSSHPQHIIGLLVCVSCRGMAIRSLDQLLNSGQCDAALLEEIRQFLAELKPFDEMREVVDISERFSTLEFALNVSGGYVKSEEILDAGELFDSLAQAPCNRNVMLQAINQWYDKLAAAVEIEDLDERQVALDQFESELQREIMAIQDGGKITTAIFNQTARGELMGRIFISLLLPSTAQAAVAEERGNLQLQLLCVAVALEQFKVETGAYPDSLAALTDRIDPALLNDPYSKAQLRYERRKPGYLLYSFSRDRLDDGGSATDGETIAGDWVSGERISLYPNGDTVLRFPLPNKTFLDPPPWEVPADEEALQLETETEPPGEEQSPPEAALAE